MMLLAPDPPHRAAAGAAVAGPRARQPGRRHARAAALRARGAAGRRPGAGAPARPRPLRLGREPLPALPAGRGHGPRRRRRRQGPGLRALARAPRDVPRRRHEPQRPGPDRRHPGRRAPPLVGRRRVEDGGAPRARAAAARCSGYANRLLRRHGHALGPDPASTDIATVGGVIANNSGGMRCGTTWDSYSTVRSMTLVLASGTVIDTAAPDAEERFAAAEPELARGPARAARRAARRRRAGRARPAQVRDQEHDGLPAVRVPRRRHAARDLPPAGRRLGGDAGLRRRGGLRDAARARAHHGLLAALPLDRGGRRAGARSSSPRARAPSS